MERDNERTLVASTKSRKFIASNVPSNEPRGIYSCFVTSNFLEASFLR